MKLRKQLFWLMIVSVCLARWNQSYAQSYTPQQVIEKIYRSYDSANYLSFDVKYSYTSDTVNGDFLNDKLAGSYTIAGKKAKFNLGDVEFMQNDSFLISVYTADKFILVSDPRNGNTGHELPSRQVLDSFKTRFPDHYSVTYTSSGDTATWTFNKYDSIAQYLKFAITYDTAQNILYSINYVFEETVPQDSLGYALPPLVRKKQLKVDFSNYRFDNFSEPLYNQNNYIFFENGVCKPVEKYNDYRIYYTRTGNINTTYTIPEPEL